MGSPRLRDLRWTILLKPTLIYAATGAVMLKPGWINRYSPPKALASASNANAVFDDVWAALFFITTATDLVFAVLATRVAWAWFAGVFPTASKIVLIVIQYAVTRAIVRRRIRTSTGFARVGR